MSFGPNDYHFAQGQLLQGLGADEPSEKARIEMSARTEQEREREDRIAAAQAAVERDSAALDTRENDLAAREADLAARMKELEAKLEEMTAPAGGRGR